MHYPLTDIQADCVINRPVRYQNTAKRNYIHRLQTDRQTIGRTDGQTSRTTTIDIISKKEKTTKNHLNRNSVEEIDKRLLHVCVKREMKMIGS